MFSKNSQISDLTKTRLVGVELFHADRWTDGRRGMRKLSVVLRNFANATRNLPPYPEVRHHRGKSEYRARFKIDGTRWSTEGEVKGKLTNGVGSQYSHTTSERGVSSITKADAHTSAASSRMNWGPRRFKWTRPFRRKTKSGFCACAIRFQTSSSMIYYSHKYA